MTVRCICCQKEVDIADIKATYVYVHEGSCGEWLLNREAMGPSWIWTLFNNSHIAVTMAILAMVLIVVVTN